MPRLARRLALERILVGCAVLASLTAMALCVGYLVASTGPWILGAVHDLSGTWSRPLVALLAVRVAQLAPGVYACADRTVR